MKTLIISLTIMILMPFMSKTLSAQNLESQQKVESSYVCYVNNKYMGKEQIPVEVEGKTYYGCCQGCVGKLENKRHFRYANDPLTGEEVDKAKAYIVTKGNNSKEVYYFANKANYEKYNSK